MSSRCVDRLSSQTAHPRRGAFVLVMVLALLTVCALCLAGLARRSLDAGEQVASARTDLQRRWGVVSCTQTYLPLAKDLFEAEVAKLPAQARVWPLPASVGIEFDLGDLHFSVLLADEEAKANLNAISRCNPDGQRAVASVVEERTAGVDGLAVNLQALLRRVPRTRGQPARTRRHPCFAVGDKSSSRRARAARASLRRGCAMRRGTLHAGGAGGSTSSVLQTKRSILSAGTKLPLTFWPSCSRVDTIPALRGCTPSSMCWDWAITID